MFVNGNLPLPLQGNMVLRQDGQEGGDGDLGAIFTSLVIGGGVLIASLLGGGWLWTKHEELELAEEEGEEFRKWREIYQNPPYNMLPADAIRAARGIVKPSGFDFGLNAPTVILVGASVFALYVGSQVVISWLSPGKK